LRILFVSSSPLKKEISIGNTFINLFKDMNDIELASIYTRAGVPDEEISKAFCITEKMLIKSLIKKTPVGVTTEFCDKASNAKTLETKNEQSAIRFMKSRRWTVFFWLQNLIWTIGRWKSPQLKQFVDEYNPDVIFTVLSDSIFLNKLILHIKKITGVPLVLYAWDNNYSLKRIMFSPLKWINHFMNRRMMRKTANAADVMYVISDVQKKDYEKSFSRECKVLTKGENFDSDEVSNRDLNNPLQLVFTGNIGMNRWKSLAHIANVLERINVNGIKAQLRVYTGNDVTGRIKNALQKENTSFLMGSVSAQKIVEIQEKADILVHVESTDIKNRLLVRQSFSTKLVDYFHKCKCIVAYGPKDVASISHLIKNDAAIVADSEKELEGKLNMIIENTDLIKEYGQKSWQCGKKNHQRKDIQSILKDDFDRIISK